MKRILLLLTAFVFSIGLNAQLIPPATSPTLQSIEKSVDTKVKTIADNRSKGILKSGIDRVPVVVHIIHRGEPIDFNDRVIEQPYGANISYDQIVSSINNLNERFANTWVNYWEDPIEDVNARQSRSVNSQVQFSFAKRNPEGGPTDGIIRHNINNIGLEEAEIIKFMEEGINILGYEGTGSDKGASEIAIKEAVGWDPDKYVNIYVVPEIMDNNSTCGVVWHSTFPNESNTQGARDGIIIQANRMGYGAHTGSLKGLNIDLVQAMGQYLMLYPVWYGNMTCDDAIDAYNAGQEDPTYCETNGDHVCDTDPIPWGCNGNCIEDPCATLQNNPMPAGWESTTTNYMYPLGSNFCPDHFTQGQIDRMQACLEGPRNSLLTNSDVLNPLSVYDLKTDISIERTCYDNYKPTVIVTNTGFNDVTSYTVSVEITSLGISMSFDENDLGPILTGTTLNIPFPELVIPNNGFYNVLATASITTPGILEPFIENNAKTYPLTKYSDGFINISATYRGTSGAPLYSIRNTDSGDLVLDTKKVFNNIAFSNREDIHANIFSFAGFLEYGGQLAEEYGISGNIAPNVTYWVGNSGPVDKLPYNKVTARYYLPPGNYAIAMSANRVTSNSGLFSIFSTYGCDPATDGTGCELTVDALSNLLTELDRLYTLDEYSGLDPATGSNPYEYSAEYVEIPFTVVNNNNYSESCCVDSNNDGICDGFNLDELDPSITIVKDPNPQPTSLTMGAVVDREGVSQLLDVEFQLATDPAFTNLIATELVPYSQVNEEYFLLKKEISVEITGLTEDTQYYGRVRISDRGENYYSSVIAERTTVDACGGASSITFNGRDYPLVTIGNQCWFAKNLQSDRLAASAGGTALTDGTLALDWWTALGNGGTPAFAAVDGLNNTQLWDNGYGYFYNVTAAMTNGLCPDGFRVPYNADWMQLDTALGLIKTGTKLMIESRGGTNSTGFSDVLAGRRYAAGGSTVINNPATGTVSDNNQGGYSVFWTQDPFILSQPLGNWTSADSAYGFKDFEGLGASVNGEYYGNYMHFENLWYYNGYGNSGGYSVRCMKGGIGDNGVPQVVDVCTKYATYVDNPNGTGQIQKKYCNYNPAGTEFNESGCSFLDECGVCGGEGIPDGFCNCEGEVLDAVGVCGGPCPQDADGDGICDVVFRETGGDESLCDYEYSINYRGVDYAIGGYGGNCWFLDNLRTNQWSDGSFITSSAAGSSWAANSEAELSIVNTRSDLSPQDRDLYGYLYNWYAVNDSKGLCPSGWHVSSEDDWEGLERSLGMPENEIIRNSIRGEESGCGQVLRTGAIEFNSKPAGIITGDDGKLRGSGLEAYYWTSTPWNTIKLQYQNNAYHRAILGQNTTDGIVRYNHSWGTSGSKKHGLSVRCVKNK